MMGGGSGFDFSEETGYRDVFYAGDCDHGVVELAKLLGWEVRVCMYCTQGSIYSRIEIFAFC